jgi:hypothetical protein
MYLEPTILHVGPNVTQLIVKLLPFYLPIISNLHKRTVAWG